MRSLGDRRFGDEAAGRLYQRAVALVVPHSPAPAAALEQLFLFVSGACNLGCDYCFAGLATRAPSPRYLMAPETAVRSIDTCIEHFGSVGRIRFFGGEPLLNRRTVMSVCQHLRRRQESEALPLPSLHINTNLTLLDEAWIRLIARDRITVTVGLDGPPEVHDVTRPFPGGEGSFQLIDRNIRRLLAATGQPRSLECVYTAEHYRRGITPSDVFRFLRTRYPTCHLIIHPAVGILGGQPRGCGHRLSSSGLDPGTLRDLFRDYGRLLTSECAATARAFVKQLGESSHCSAYCETSMDSLAVAHDGRVYPCQCFMDNDDFRLADSCAAGALKAPRFDSLRRSLCVDCKATARLCRECAIQKTCHCCPAEMLADSGSLAEPVDAMCAYQLGLTEGKLLGTVEALESDALEDHA